MEKAEKPVSSTLRLCCSRLRKAVDFAKTVFLLREMACPSASGAERVGIQELQCRTARCIVWLANCYFVSHRAPNIVHSVRRFGEGQARRRHFFLYVDATDVLVGGVVQGKVCDTTDASVPDSTRPPAWSTHWVHA